MRRYDHAERMIRGINWQGKKELYAVLLRELRRTDTTEHELQHEYDQYRRAEMMRAYGASERQIDSTLKEHDMNPDYPRAKAPQAPFPQIPVPPLPVLTTAEQVQQAKQALEQAEAALATENERNELAAKIDAEIALAEATRTLLADIRILRLTNNQTHRRKEFAVYRKELAALAASYDVKIVLVGDKSAAVLVLN